MRELIRENIENIIAIGLTVCIGLLFIFAGMACGC